MKVQEVILQAMAKWIRLWPAVEILGISGGSMPCWNQHGYNSLLDRRWILAETVTRPWTSLPPFTTQSGKASNARQPLPHDAARLHGRRGGITG